MAFQLLPDRSHDSSAPIASAFCEFSLSPLLEFLIQRMPSNDQTTNGSLWGQRGLGVSVQDSSPSPVCVRK
jgi:hypothetical protein